MKTVSRRDKCISVLWDYVEKYGLFHFSEIIRLQFVVTELKIVKNRTSMSFHYCLYMIIPSLLCTYTLLIELVFSITFCVVVRVDVCISCLYFENIQHCK